MQPAKRLNDVPMYVFAAHGARLKKLAAEGLDIIRLDIGEPDAPPPAFIIDSWRNRLVTQRSTAMPAMAAHRS
jgi:aspartate/methionine/tyrosine aminotransferase